MLTRRVRYEHLRKGIRRACTEYLDQISHGRAECISSKGPLRFRIQTPWGPKTEAELELGKEGIVLRAEDVAVDPLLSGSKLTFGGPILKLNLAVKNGRMSLEPVELEYSKLRPILYLVGKQLLPTHLEAEYSFSDSEFTIHFDGGKFEGELRFESKEVVLELQLKGFAALASPIVASQIDSQLDRWTDEWVTA